MRQTLFILLGIAIVSAAAVGILVWSYDPYQTSAGVKVLFFTGSAVLVASLIGMLYGLVRIFINRFKKS